MEENLKSLEKFFKYNLEVKKILHTTAPKEEYAYNKEYLIEYVDKLERALNDIQYYINEMIESFCANDDKSYFNNFIRALKSELISYGYDFDKLKKFYNTFFASMNEELVKEVGSNCVGYSMYRGINLSKGKSINEILHIVHQKVINNENVYKKLPILSKKQNESGYDITLYGRENEIAHNIFNSLPKSFSSGDIDIMSVGNDKTILMARDIGHALVVEIEKENDKYYVNYFIPKICNINMINGLKGVKKVTMESKYTVGNFSTEPERISLEVFNLLSNVPKDEHMFIEGGRFYREEESKKI